MSAGRSRRRGGVPGISDRRGTLRHQVHKIEQLVHRRGPILRPIRRRVSLDVDRSPTLRKRSPSRRPTCRRAAPSFRRPRPASRCATRRERFGSTAGAIGGAAASPNRIRRDRCRRASSAAVRSSSTPTPPRARRGRAGRRDQRQDVVTAVRHGVPPGCFGGGQWQARRRSRAATDIGFCIVPRAPAKNARIRSSRPTRCDASTIGTFASSGLCCR